MRPSLKALLISLMMLLMAGPVLAASLSEVIRTLEAPFQSGTPAEQRIFDYTADFFQEARIVSLDRLQRANGRVAVRFSDSRTGDVPRVMFRWEYEQPTTQELVSDGKTLWVYLPENNQVIQSDIEFAGRSRENDPMTFLTGLGNLSRDFSINWAQPDHDIEGNYILDLQPRRPSTLIRQLQIVVARNAVEARSQAQQGQPGPQVPIIEQRPFRSGTEGIWFPILSTTVTDPNGNSTIIEFSNLRVNLSLPVSQFQFIMPAGVEVVRPTGKEMGF